MIRCDMCKQEIHGAVRAHRWYCDDCVKKRKKQKQQEYKDRVEKQKAININNVILKL